MQWSVVHRALDYYFFTKDKVFVEKYYAFLDTFKRSQIYGVDGNDLFVNISGYIHLPLSVSVYLHPWFGRTVNNCAMERLQFNRC